MCQICDNIVSAFEEPQTGKSILRNQLQFRTMYIMLVITVKRSQGWAGVTWEISTPQKQCMSRVLTMTSISHGRGTMGKGKILHRVNSRWEEQLRMGLISSAAKSKMSFSSHTKPLLGSEKVPSYCVWSYWPDESLLGEKRSRGLLWRHEQWILRDTSRSIAQRSVFPEIPEGEIPKIVK